MSIMKHLKQYSSLFIGLLLVVVVSNEGCKRTIEGELGDPFDKVKGMAGTWELRSFIQKDLNNPIKEERDLSEFYIVDGIPPLQITFGEDRSYSVAITEGKNYFGSEGDWRFDNDEYPTFIYLENETDTLQFELGRVVREFDNELQIELPRGCDLGETNEVPTVIYRFIFNRQNG